MQNNRLKNASIRTLNEDSVRCCAFQRRDFGYASVTPSLLFPFLPARLAVAYEICMMKIMFFVALNLWRAIDCIHMLLYALRWRVAIAGRMEWPAATMGTVRDPSVWSQYREDTNVSTVACNPF